MSNTSRRTLLTLPAEIRDQIWSEVVRGAECWVDNEKRFRFDLALLRTCKQIHQEADRSFHIVNTFIDISTPFENAHIYVAKLAKIAILQQDCKWRDTRLKVTVEAPLLQIGLENKGWNFIILAEDLVAFCKHWYNQQLDRPEINTVMTLKLLLKNLELPNEMLPQAKQIQLLEPFGIIKDLSKVEVFGAYPEVEEELRKAMSVPQDSPNKCLLKANALKSGGNLALKNGKWQDALDLYRQAFMAIHVRIDGREREIHGERLFNDILEEPVENERRGQIVYFLMRTRLVANTVEAYLKMENWEEAYFWGKRSVDLLRDIAGHMADAPNSQIPGGSVWGKIYYRTGVAAEKLDDMIGAREMYRYAHTWLPHDELVTEAFSRTALKLG